MEYRLLVDIDAIDVLDALPPRVRRRLLNRLREVVQSPDRYSQYREKDLSGRDVDVTILEGYAIYYWVDFPDRHIKVMAIVDAGT